MMALLIIGSCLTYFVLVGVTHELLDIDDEVGRFLVSLLWPAILPVLGGKALVHLPEAIVERLAARRERKALPRAEIARRS